MGYYCDVAISLQGRKGKTVADIHEWLKQNMFLLYEQFEDSNFEVTDTEPDPEFGNVPIVEIFCHSVKWTYYEDAKETRKALNSIDEEGNEDCIIEYAEIAILGEEYGDFERCCYGIAESGQYFDSYYPYHRLEK